MVALSHGPLPAGKGVLRANTSFNRTLHSLPAFGPPFHSGPNTINLFRAGYLKRCHQKRHLRAAEIVIAAGAQDV